MTARLGGRLEELTRDECLSLLDRNRFGRLALVVDDQPLVFPVNYAMSGQNIVFRTDPGTKLHAGIGRRVAFEIDSADPFSHDGWSVLVVGVAEEERDAARLRAYADLPFAPWAAGPKAHWCCIKGGVATGRRITHTTIERNWP